MTRRWATLLVAALLAVPAATVAQSMEAGPVKLDFTGRVQVQFNTTDVAGEVGSRFETRRIRAAFELEIDQWITGKVEPDFAGGSVALKDAWVNLAIDPRFELKAGHFKKPFGLLELTSSSKFPSVERGLRLRGVSGLLPGLPGEEYELLDGNDYLGRDLGAAAHGSLGMVSYMVGVFNGAGGGQVDEGKAVAGRLSVAPLSERLLTVSAGVSRSATLDAAQNTVGGTAYEVDAEWGGFRRPGLRLLAEYMHGDNLAQLDAQSDPAAMMGAHLVAGWFTPLEGHRVEGIEVVGRASYGDPDTSLSNDEGMLLTPGVTLYFEGRNRLQVNWEIYAPSSDAIPTHSGLVTQLQMYF